MLACETLWKLAVSAQAAALRSGFGPSRPAPWGGSGQIL
jgi:hypothetical protein